MSVAALDIGLKRIGVAVSLDEKVVIPQNAVLRRGREQAAKAVRELLEEWEVDRLVVGVPEGGKSEAVMRRRIEHFVSLLQLPPSVSVVYEDESGSSEEAKERMRGAVRQKRDGRIDSLAAMIILERWLERRGRQRR